MSSFTLLVLKLSRFPSNSRCKRWLKVRLAPFLFNRSEAVSKTWLGHFWLLGHSCGPMNGTMKEVISFGENRHLNETDLSQIPIAGTIWRVLSKQSTRSQVDVGSNEASWIIFSCWWKKSIFFKITSAASVTYRRIIWSLLVTTHKIWCLEPFDTSVAVASLMSTLLIKVLRTKISFSFILCCCTRIFFQASLYFQSLIQYILQILNDADNASLLYRLFDWFTTNLSLRLLKNSLNLNFDEIRRF